MRIKRCIECGCILNPYCESDICDCCLDDMRDEEVDH